MTLNNGQAQALKELTANNRNRILLGNAGSGKTYLMDQFTQRMVANRKKVVVTAPTHKATSVLRGKVKHPDVGCQTIHSLLGLTPREGDNGTVLHRNPRATPVEASVVVVDEASMITQELYDWIERLLYRQKIVFSGDDAQLPPVGEAISPVFAIKDRSILSEPVRQARDNPILSGALLCRDHQKVLKDDFTYLQPQKTGSHGIFSVDSSKKAAWVRKAFLSGDFKSDPNAFRYLAWTNAVVDDVNRRIQYLIYGDIDTPLAPSEVALNRKRFSYNGVEINTSEEVVIERIEPGVVTVDWDQYGGDEQFEIEIWRVVTQCGRVARMVRNQAAYQKALRYIQKVFKQLEIPLGGYGVYQHLSDFRDSFAHMTSNFAMTVHNSQGSTFGSVFVDQADIMKRRRTNLLETHQLFYVAMTRPQNMVFCI